jgi:hypothetical protein
LLTAYIEDVDLLRRGVAFVVGLCELNSVDP